MHNGGMATLEEVLEFYIRGGNFEVPPKEFGKVFSLVDLQLSAENREDLLNFLKSLTDDRVRYEKAPFDHPELVVPHGHTGNNVLITTTHALNDNFAADEYFTVPAVGAEGRGINPLHPFERYLQ